MGFFAKCLKLWYNSYPKCHSVRRILTRTKLVYFSPSSLQSYSKNAGRCWPPENYTGRQTHGNSLDAFSLAFSKCMHFFTGQILKINTAVLWCRMKNGIKSTSWNIWPCWFAPYAEWLKRTILDTPMLFICWLIHTIAYDVIFILFYC